MAELRMRPGPPNGPMPSRQLVIPLWGLLLVALMSLLVIFAYWPRGPVRMGALVDPQRDQAQELTYRGHRYAMVPDALHRQELHAPSTMREIGVAHGVGLYVPRAGGGGASGSLFVRSGNDLFIPLRPRT